MKTCLLNLPYPTRIIRRYNCTYYAPNFLFPPIELMYLGAIIKEWKNEDCILIDAIAERLNLNRVINHLKSYQPDLLVFMAGIESYAEDMQMIANIKLNLSSLKIACIGYLPSIFTKETLENNHIIDYLIINEPEISFSELYDEIKASQLTDIPIKGVAKRYNGRLIIGQERPRIKDLDLLPFPDRSLIKQKFYNEFLLPQPFTTIQTSRGCPFECTYCIPTYGRKVTFRSLEGVLGEIEEAVLKYKIRTIRFMDDTFTVNKDRVIKFCDSILKKGLKFHWSALSRVDKLDKETLSLMKRSGCKRLYLGIETGSQRLLDFYKKGYSADSLKRQIKLVKDIGIEAVGFFMVGGIQTEEEFRRDVSLSKELKLDYIIVERLTCYPGTALFNSKTHMCAEEKALEWEKIFYRNFYLRPRYIMGKFKDFIFNIKDARLGMQRLTKFLSLPHLSARTARREMI